MSDKAIATCAFITLGSTFGSSVAPKENCGSGELPSFKLLLGTSLTFLSLSVMDNFIPKVATLLSASMALTATMYFAVPVINCYLYPNSSFCKECKSETKVLPPADQPATVENTPNTPAVVVPGLGDAYPKSPAVSVPGFGDIYVGIPNP